MEVSASHGFLEMQAKSMGEGREEGVLIRSKGISGTVDGSGLHPLEAQLTAVCRLLSI